MIFFQTFFIVFEYFIIIFNIFVKKRMKLSDIRQNPDNPRTVDDFMLDKLVNSIRSFPKMMELRPIVVDENNTVLGGNMRLKAIQLSGLDEIPNNWVIKASNLTEEQKKEFIIKDNVAIGEWDFKQLEGWNQEDLSDWGLNNWDANVNIDNFFDESVEKPKKKKELICPHCGKDVYEK